MLYFPEPGAGVVAALEIMEGLAWAGLPPAHVGLHAGPVLYQEGDHYGRTVNLASRIADHAAPPMRSFVSQAVVDAAGSVSASFTEVGLVELNGVGERSGCSEQGMLVDRTVSEPLPTAQQSYGSPLDDESSHGR